MINAHNAMSLIIVNINLMEILMDNAYARQAIMMIINIQYANNALYFGKKIYRYYFFK